MDFDFVVVNYKHTDETARLLDQLHKTFHHPYTVTVIDNTLDNRGFAKATNLGASLGSAEIIGFLNPDILLVDGWADATIATLAENSNIVICGPRLDDGYGWPRDLRTSGIKNWVCGACYFVRRDFFESRGGFDERYYFTHEETDLIRQAESLGYDVLAVDTEQPLIKHIRHDSVFHGEQLRAAAEQYRRKWATR